MYYIFIDYLIEVRYYRSYYGYVDKELGFYFLGDGWRFDNKNKEGGYFR